MSLLQGFAHRLQVLLRREAYMREVERELRFHVDLERAAQSRSGDVDRELAARCAFGNVTYYREEVRQMTMLRWIDRVRQDAKYALRGLARAPGFTVTVVITLALGFGVNAAMYSILDQVFRRAPAGVANPDQLRRVYEDFANSDMRGARIVLDHFTYPDFRALSSAVAPLRTTAFTKPDSIALVDGTTQIQAQRSMVTAGYFSLLGLHPALGRFFAPGEEQIEMPTPVAVISNAFWRRAFGADRAVIGRVVSLHHQSVTIVGVGPADFTGVNLDATDVWLPANMYPPSNLPGPWYETYAGAFSVLTRVQAPTDEARLLALGPSAVRGVYIESWGSDSTKRILTGSIIGANGPMKPAQEVEVATKISWVAVIVLLIACANVTNLLLLRAASRKREIAVRRALGVSYARLCGQLITESTALTMLGGIAAVLVAFWTGTALRRLMMPQVRWANGPVDGHTLVFLLGVSLLVGAAAGLAPAVHAMRPNLIDSLKAGMQGGSYQRSLLRSALLVAQAALCVLLLVGAGLFLRSLNNVESIGVGYGVDDVVMVTPFQAPSDQARPDIAPALPQAAERLSKADGVEAVAYARVGPMAGSSFGPLFLPDRDSLPKLPGDIGPSYNVVSPDYFRVTSLAIRSGRAFTASDNATSSRAVIVSEAMARTYWPGTSAIGKCLIVGRRTSPCSVVVGVVADAHRRHIIEQPIMQYYLPTGQDPRAARTLVVRTQHGRERMVIAQAQRILNQLVPGLDDIRIQNLSDLLEPELRPWHLGAMLFSAFGILALIVAGIGVYSVVAYGVAQRTHEMGIRAALGARTLDILDLVLAEGMRLLFVGIFVGLAAALVLGHYVASLLFGITAYDPGVLVGSAVTLTVLALAACVVPGWRAARVNPIVALRAD
jgi:predicted permease